MEIRNNNTSFGWRYPVHSAITENAVRKSKTLFKNVNDIANSSIRPDFEERAILCQTHFYYKDTKKSFLDYTKKANARAEYNRHVTEMIKNRESNRAIALDHAGRAAHYLQDICQPQHISKGGVIKKAIERNTHKMFESLAYDSYKNLIKNANKKNNQMNARSFSDLFDKTLDESSQIDVPTKKNQNKWNDIAQSGINIAVSATNKFFEMVEQVFN